MTKIPERSLVIKKEALAGLNKPPTELAALLAFDLPALETDSVVVYGPYFDFESLDEVGSRLVACGLEFWDDYFEFKEDIPEWVSFTLLGSSSS
ncbi:hypothetical protein [uncultured Tateyamaria sp.]|uniref:hypothetical protein n=1 Tax=uncultured Tateyamaria sp. TaxID=455651 RepID=UPI0026205C8B|nr:hypothetical protein [uncultured Tateyamaria sp.]